MFCKNCNNILEISKSDFKQISNDTTPSELSDSSLSINYDDIIDKLDNNVNISSNILDNIDFVQLQNLKKLKDMPNKNKIKIKKKISELIELKENEEDNVKAFYVCKNCFYSKPINNGELLVSKLNTNNVSEIIFKDKYKNRLNSSIYPRTTNYICKNSKCKTHNGFQKEAIFIRENNSTVTWYVCSVCTEVWRL